MSHDPKFMPEVQQQENRMAEQAEITEEWRARRAASPYAGLTPDEVNEKMARDNAQLRRYAENGALLVSTIKIAHDRERCPACVADNCFVGGMIDRVLAKVEGMA